MGCPVPATLACRSLHARVASSHAARNSGFAIAASRRRQHVVAPVQFDQLATCNDVGQQHSLVRLVVIVVASEEGHGHPLVLLCPYTMYRYNTTDAL